MAVTSVGWVHAADKVVDPAVDPAIFTDLGEAVVGKPIVFNVGTAKGTSTATNVRVKISLTGDNNPATLKDMGLMYFENGKWNVWNAESDEYWFGPTSGFPIKDLVSPILMKPTVKGVYNCKLEVVQNNEVLANTTFTVDVKETSSDLMIKSDTLYSTPNAYALSHGGYCADLLMETNASIANGKGIYSTLVYAGGLPVTVSAAGDKTQIKLTAAPDSEAMVLDPTKSSIALYGGMKNAPVNETNIVMTGGTLTDLFGGGHGEGDKKGGTTADVKGKVSITISGGTISNLLEGGGKFYAKSNEVEIKISGKDTKIATLYAGGYDAGKTSNTLNTTLDQSVNGVQKFTLTMTDGTITEGIGCGGGQGYSYTGKSNVSLTNVKIASFYGVLANGRANDIVATVTNCTFENFGPYYEFASVNRGSAANIDFTFDGCTFKDLNKINACLGPVNGWADSDTNGNIIPIVTGKAKYVFKNTKTDAPVMQIGQGLEEANIELIGAKAKVSQFIKKNPSETISTFEIGSNKVWTLENGLSIDKECTLTNNGTLNIKGIDNVADLQSAVAVGANSIGLTAKTFGLPSHLLISKPMVIEGTITAKDSTIIRPASNWSGNEGINKNLIRIDASNTMLKNLLVEGSTIGSGIHVHKATGVTLDNVISRNNTAAGLIVNGSTVTATNFRTSGNGWYGVNVDKGEGVVGTPVFTIGTGCSFAEKVAIKSDLSDAPASYVVGNGWFKTKQEGASVWVNGAATGFDFSITSVPASVIYGQANLPLLTNVDSAYYKAGKVKISILDDKTDVVKIKTTKGQPDSLEIVKPGDAVLVLAVGDTTVSQPLTVLKKTLTITGITTKARSYSGSKNVTLVTTDMVVNGLVEKDKLKTDVINKGITGEALSANAGIQPVKVTATLNNSYEDYYELAEITGVMDTITKVKLTVTATVTGASADKDTSIVDYGTLPTFDVTYSGFVNSEVSSALSGTLKYNSSATTTSLAGTYSVTPSGYTATNYDIEYVSAPFKIKAIAPTVEMTGVEVISLGTGANNASVKVTGRVTSNGGTKMEDLQGSFKVKTNGNYEVKAQDLTVENDGTFSATLTGLASVKTSIQAFAKAGELENTEADNKALSVNLALKLQNVSFATTFSTLTYGIDPISLTAKDFEEGAEVTFTSSDASILEIADSNKMSVVKPGVATITVTATKEGHITAVAKQTITVKKKALAVTAEPITKKYDGTTDVQVTGKLPDQKGLQAASLASDAIKAHFANKNVGTSSVKLAGEFALSAGGDFYELVQPTNLTGTITSGGDVTVEVSNVTRNYNEKALRYDLRVLVDGKELASSEYTGTVSVTETTGKYNVSVKEIKVLNYGTVKAAPASGNVDIIKGTPKVLTYNVSNTEIGGLLVDAEGWEDAKVRLIGEADGKAHASIYYNGDKDSIVGKSLANATPPNFDWNFNAPKSMMKATKAVTTQSVQYGQTATFTKAKDVSFESSNPNVFVVKEGTDGNNMMIETIGVGTAAIIAKGTGSNAGVTCLQVTVDPKPITLTANTIEKVYDGTTTAHVTLTPSDELVGASIDLTGVSFNFAHSNVGTNITVSPSKEIVLKNNNDVLASAANYTISISNLTGNITTRELTFTGTEVNKFYDGTNTAELTDYSATGLIEGETVPALTATFKEAEGNADAKNVATGLKVTLALNGNSNYMLAKAADLKGNIVKSTIDATLPAGASSDANLAANVALVVREIGKKVTPSQISFVPLVSHEGSGSTAVYYISGGDNNNYSVVYDKNQIGYKANTTPPDGGGDVEETVTISLNASSKVLPRTEEFELTATVSPAGKTVEWSSSDPTIATVTANGNKATVKGIKLGKATITAKIGDVTATCLVTVDFATGIEEMLAQTEVYSQQGNIIVNPVQPLQLTIVNMTGQTVYNDYISGSTQIPARSGVYIVKLSNAGNTIISKLIVR